MSEAFLKELLSRRSVFSRPCPPPSRHDGARARLSYVCIRRVGSRRAPRRAPLARRALARPSSPSRANLAIGDPSRGSQPVGRDQGRGEARVGEGAVEAILEAAARSAVAAAASDGKFLRVMFGSKVLSRSWELLHVNSCGTICARFLCTALCVLLGYHAMPSRYPPHDGTNTRHCPHKIPASIIMCLAMEILPSSPITL